MMPETQHEEWRERIDIDMRAQGERLAGVEAGVSSLGRTFDQFYKTFEQSSTNQRELQKTQWPVIFAVLGLVMIIAGGFLSGYLRDLNRVEDSVTEIKSKRISEEDPGQDIRLQDLEAEIIGIRANEHITFAKDAKNAAAVSTVAELRREFINHARDGHPARIEELMRLRMDMFITYKDEIRLVMQRELKLRDEIRDAIHDRLTRIELRWEQEHASGGHHE